MKQIDYKLFFSVFALIIFGSITISSVSVFASHNITSLMVAKWQIKEAYNYFYVIKNLIHVSLAFFLIALFAKIPYKTYQKYYKEIIFWAYLLLIAVFIPHVWTKIKWAVWWIDLKILPFFIQPTEFMKIALIIFLAAYLTKTKKYLHDFKKGFLTFLGVMW